MALPWLQSLPVWGEDATSASDAPQFPKRFGVLFMQSVLDRVGEHASELRRRASVDDRRKLDEFLSSVRDSERKLCSLYLSLMNRMGVEADRFGDADVPLADI